MAKVNEIWSREMAEIERLTDEDKAIIELCAMLAHEERRAIKQARARIA